MVHVSKGFLGEELKKKKKSTRVSDILRYTSQRTGPRRLLSLLTRDLTTCIKHVLSGAIRAFVSLDDRCSSRARVNVREHEIKSDDFAAARKKKKNHSTKVAFALS